MQTSAMKACFQIAECSLSSAKININYDTASSETTIIRTAAFFVIKIPNLRAKIQGTFEKFSAVRSNFASMRALFS